VTIYDIFETENYSAYSGSYNARVFFGDFFSRISNNERVVIADRVTGLISSSFYDQRFTYLASFAYPMISGSAIGHNTRFLTLPCAEEVFTDSQTPSPLYYNQANIGNIVIDEATMTGSSYYNIPRVGPTGSAMIAFGYSSLGTGKSNPSETVWSDYVWTFSYPFMSRYKGFVRFNNPSYRLPYPISTTITRSRDAGNGFEDSVALTTSRLSYFYIVDVGPLGSSVRTPSDPIFVSGVLGIVAGSPLTYPLADRDRHWLPSAETQNRVYFGVGHGNYSLASRGRITISEGISNYQVDILLKGWKYGLYSGNPLASNMVLRPGHHGYLRDTLEQRPYTKFFDTKSRKTLSAAVTMTPLTGTLLYSQSLDYVTATNPTYNPRDSGAWDYECRSGQPFFDLERV